ncbi:MULTISPECIES: universal stress protein [Sphingomonas]|jgi:nucleotide-binding universal stress UspA family protein|uniref:universal stress protein n=2 Tax=Pseudomonadota TaxID=1224 RepID=UPI001AE47FDA
MKTILLLVHDDGGQEARFQAALDLTRTLEGHLVCLDVTIMPAMVVSDALGDAGFGMLLQEEKQRETTNRAKLEARLVHEDVSWDWRDACGEVAPCLRDESALADLIVVNRQLEACPVPDMRALAGDLVVKGRTPVLAVPEDLVRLDLDRALIAWDGSASSGAAVRAAVPLLRHAQQVTIIAIGDESDRLPAEAAAAYLSRYDIHAEIDHVALAGEKVGDALFARVSSGHFGYVVMGGFGHARVAEALFGGVTRMMLTKSPVPIFLAH